MEKILFIVPPYLKYDTFINPAFNDGIMVKKSGKYRNIVADIPIGLLSLSSYLKKHTSADVRLIDFNIVLHKMKNFTYKSFSELFHAVLSSEEWQAYAPTLIGVSALFTPSYYNMLDVADAARKIYPDAIVTAGGGVPTNMYSEIFRDSTSFDALCYGEGEKPLRALLEAPDKETLLKVSPSWITRDKASGKQMFSHDYIENLDEIPFLDYGLIDIDDYRINPVIATYPLLNNKMKSMSVMTSRGCTHRCCFCASHTVHGRKMRYYSIDRVREDLRRLRDEYGTMLMVFFDDHFMASKQRVFEILDILRESEITAFFANALAIYALDRRVIEALKSVGVNQIVLSIESGSDRVLKKIMHKPLSLSTVKRVVADCRALGIDTDANILIGLPGETKQDIEDALAFLKTIDATWFRINVATPLVGSEMLDVCLKKNYLKGDYLDSEYKRAIVETEDYTAEYIQEKAYAMNLELNFVGNSDFRLGNYDIAVKGFENTIRVKSDHAFAYYYAAKCYLLLGRDEKYAAYKAKYEDIMRESEFWRNYAHQFGIVPLG